MQHQAERPKHNSSSSNAGTSTSQQYEHYSNKRHSYTPNSGSTNTANSCFSSCSSAKNANGSVFFRDEQQQQQQQRYHQRHSLDNSNTTSSSAIAIPQSPAARCLHDNLLLRSRSAGVQGSPRILPKLECLTNSSSTQMSNIDSSYTSPQDFLPLRKIATAPDMMSSSYIGSEPTRYGGAGNDSGSSSNMMNHHRLFRRASKSKLISRQRQGLEPLTTDSSNSSHSSSLSMMTPRRDSFADSGNSSSSSALLQHSHQQQTSGATASLSPTVTRY
jgi:hypothetical protein